MAAWWRGPTIGHLFACGGSVAGPLHHRYAMVPLPVPGRN